MKYYGHVTAARMMIRGHGDRAEAMAEGLCAASARRVRRHRGGLREEHHAGMLAWWTNVRDRIPEERTAKEVKA